MKKQAIYVDKVIYSSVRVTIFVVERISVTYSGCF